MGVVGLLLQFYRRFFHNVSFWEKVPSASHDDVITQLGHNKASRLDLDDEASRLLCQGSYGEANCIE